MWFANVEKTLSTVGNAGFLHPLSLCSLCSRIEQIGRCGGGGSVSVEGMRSVPRHRSSSEENGAYSYLTVDFGIPVHFTTGSTL
jgi:hypothetical protein